MTEPTLQLTMPPQLGAKVEISRHRIRGKILAATPEGGEWRLDIVPDTALDDSEVIPGVLSSGVDYVDEGGGLRPVTPRPERLS